MKTILITSCFLCTVAVIALTAQEKTTTTTEHKVVLPNDLQWADAAPTGLPPGAKMAVLDGDPTKSGSFTVRMKAPAGYKIPPHTHPTDERVTVISGSFKIGMGDKFDEASAHEMGPGVRRVTDRHAALRHVERGIDCPDQQRRPVPNQLRQSGG